MPSRSPTLAFLCLCAAALPLAPTLHAQTVVNGNFEAPAFSSSGVWGYAGNSNLNGSTWTFNGSSGMSGATGPWAPSGGTTSQFAFIQLNGGTDPRYFSQTMTFTSAGTFTLSYDEATRNNYGNPNIDYTVSLTRVSDSTIVFSANDSSTNGQNFTATNYTVSVPAAGSYVLKFEGNVNGNTTDRAVLFDNIAFTSAIPEPSTWATLAGAAALLGAVWSRRKSRAARA